MKTPGGWRIVFGHNELPPPVFGVEPDYQVEHGGMKFAEVAEGGPAATAGFKSGDVLIHSTAAGGSTNPLTTKDSAVATMRARS
ncbi:MAG: hypothetical protein WB762_26680 [Candidatus Sulfotelmatobacter sp.]